MTLKITKVNLPKSKYNRKCPYKMTAKYIVIHNTDNDASAMNEVSYMQRNNNQVSFHFAVDDTRAVQGIDLNRNAWHAGDGSKGKGNRYGIAIEICYSKSGGKKFSKAEDNAAKLAAKLLYDRGWGLSHLKRHKDFSGKNCPKRTMKLGWNRFKKKVDIELKLLKGKKKTVSKIKVGDKVNYNGYIYTDSYGNGKSKKVKGTFKVNIKNSNAYGTHLKGYGWAKTSLCKKV